jgi:streptogramin lyase
MRATCAIVLSCCVLLISGCIGKPAMTTTSTQPDQVQGAALHGRVHGGQNPVSGASVYLYAVGTGGYGGNGIAASSSNASTSLLNSNVLSQTPAGGKDGSNNYYATTDSNGNFSISGDYTCPSADTQVYLFAKGGNAGAGVYNGIGMLAGLGSCGSLSSSTFVTVNEVSTVVTAYALAGFATDATHISSSGTTLALQGMANAFAMIPNMETLSTGVALATTPAGNGVVWQKGINALANILASCVNTAIPPVSPYPCTTLLLINGSVPETATAAIAIAHNPASGNSVSTLLALQTANPPFQPTTTSTNDFTMAISYTGSGLDGQGGLAIDASGNVWVVSYTGNVLSKFGPTGAVLSGSGGFTGNGLNGPNAVAIDSSGNAWVVNYSGSSLSEFNSSGSPISGSPYTGGGLNDPQDLAIDQSGHVWAVNYGNTSISEFSSGGSPITGSGGITTGGLDDPTGVAIDVSGNVWVPNYDASGISEFNSSGTANAGSPFTGGGLDSPYGVAIDAAGDVWATNLFGGSLSELSSSGSALSPATTGYTGGGLNYPCNVAIDGDGNAFATNNYYGGGSEISEANSAGNPISGTYGYQGGLYGPYSLAIDGSGNVWVSNWGGGGGDYISEYVGLAAPVVTPIVANLLAPYGSHAVNKP